MGLCFSQEGRRLHERLDEYDDDYLVFNEKNRNPGKESDQFLSERKPSNIAKESFDQLETDRLEQGQEDLLEHHFILPSSESEPSGAADPFEDISFSLSAPSRLQDFYIKPFPQPNAFPKKRQKFYAGNASKWHDKRKGRALQLRLAKHHFLQMAVTNQSAPNGSFVAPHNITSGFLADSDTKISKNVDSRDLSDSWPLFTPALPPAQLKAKEANKLFNRSRGLIWKEIICENNVTAVAMNRIIVDSPIESIPRTKEPLLLAMGDEKGKIVITQIMDETLQSTDDKQRGVSLLKRGMDLDQETLAISIEGKVRSLDFGTYEHLVVGGDGCYAWILKVIADASRKILQDIVIVHKLERIDRIYAVRFSYDQKFLAVGGFDGKVALVPTTAIWNEEEQERDCESNDEDSLSQLMRDSIIEIDRPGLIYCLDWSRSSPGDYLAIAGSEKACSIYNAKNFDLIHETTKRSAAIQDVRWSNDGKYLAAGDREVAIIKGRPPFDIECDISHTPKSAMAQFRYRVTSLCWSPSDSYLAIGGSDGRCILVETKRWTLVYEYRGVERINDLAWGQQLYDANGTRRYLVLSDNEHTVALIKAGMELQDYELSEDLSSVASSSYRSQSTMSSDWVLREDEFLDLDDSQEFVTLELKPKATITTIAFSKNVKSNTASSYMAYAADDCSLTIMRTRDWKAIFQIEFAKPIRSILFSHSNNYLALGGDEGILNVLSIRSRTMILNSILSSPIRSIAFSTCDERLGVGLEDGILTLLCPESHWESIGEIEQSESCVSCQDWSSKILACGRVNGSVTLFETDKVLSNFLVPFAEFTSNHPVRSLTFRSDAEFLAIGGDNGVLTILSAKSGWTLFNQIDHGYRILSTKWSPTGHYVALAGASRRLSVYDTTTWTIVKEAKESLLSICTENESIISCLDWSVGSKWIAIGVSGSGIHILDTLTWKPLELSAFDQKLSAAKSDF